MINPYKYCPTCARPLVKEYIDPNTGQCRHGLAAPNPDTESWTGGLDLSPEQLAEMYPEHYGAAANADTEEEES